MPIWCEKLKSDFKYLSDRGLHKCKRISDLNNKSGITKITHLRWKMTFIGFKTVAGTEANCNIVTCCVFVVCKNYINFKVSRSVLLKNIDVFLSRM